MGLFAESVGAGGTVFVASVPLSGRIEVVGLILSAGVTAVEEGPHRFEFAMGSEVAADQAGLDRLEGLFPDASQTRPERRSIMVGLFSGSLYWPLQFVIEPDGRRLVAGFHNGNVVTSTAMWAGFVVKRVV